MCALPQLQLHAKENIHLDESAAAFQVDALWHDQMSEEVKKEGSESNGGG